MNFWTFTTAYSANLMALSITSNASLDQLESWAKTYFAAIENRQREPVNFTADLIDKSRPAALALVEPVKDLRTLDMTFPVTGTRSLYANKSAEMLGSLLGYEGAGSLLSYLKRTGLATSLAGGHEGLKPVRHRNRPYTKRR
jgi:insulysin